MLFLSPFSFFFFSLSLFLFFRLPFFPPSFMLSRTFHLFELHFNESVGRGWEIVVGRCEDFESAEPFLKTLEKLMLKVWNLSLPQMKGYKYDTYNRIFILLFVIVRIKKIEECHKYKYYHLTEFLISLLFLNKDKIGLVEIWIIIWNRYYWEKI